jgi:hypothetical protein
VRRLLVLIASALALLTTLVAVTPVGVAASTKYRLNPSRNIAPPRAAYGSACAEHPQGTACENIMIRALNHARSVLHEPRYDLPGAFHSLAARDQLLVLSNLDRALYGRVPIRGLNPVLNASAAVGVRDDADPQFVYRINRHGLTGGGSNWAGGTAPMNSPLFAYFSWMYDDGVGSPNIDCQHSGDSGCWGHRRDTLFVAASGDQVEMGVGAGKDRRGLFGWTELYESFPGAGTIPCLPTVVGLSKHAVRTSGTVVTIYGFGFVRVSKVTALGRPATILARHDTSLTIRVPRHPAERGYLAVYTPVGRSLLNAAAGFRYVA